MTSLRNGLPLLCFTLLLLVSAPPVSAQQTISIGKDLVYERGTSRAKEEVLEFPYRHTSGKKREYWAWVVHHERGARLIFKTDEVNREKKNPGHLTNQDFAADHPFMKTLDVIKEDAFKNLFREVLASDLGELTDWNVLSGGSAVHKKFYKNSKKQYFAIISAQDPDTKKLGKPVIVTFERTRQGPMATLLSAEGNPISPPQPANPQTNRPLHVVFELLESRTGF